MTSMFDVIRLLSPDGDDRDHGSACLMQVDTYADHQYPTRPAAPVGLSVAGEWPGQRVRDGRRVRVAAVWIDEPGGEVVVGTTYRLEEGA